MSENSDDNDSRQPRNMQGLLRYAIEAGQREAGSQVLAIAAADPRNALVLQPLDDERRRWLDDMLSTLSVNVAAIMKQAIGTLTEEEDGADETVQQKKVEALDELMEWVDSLDFANDFHKIGGFTILRPCLRSRHSDVRHRTAELVAELVQNNPTCQQAATESDLVPDLINLLDADECGTVRVKALYALSCILRDQPCAQARFAEHDGYSVLLRAMQSNVEKLKVKASFLLSSLCAQQPALKDVLCDMGFVEQLVALIQGEHDVTHEHLLGALHALVAENPSAVKECRRPELNLNETLARRLELVRGRDEFREELEFCQKLIECCFTDADIEDR